MDEGLDVPFTQVGVHCDNKAALPTIITWQFKFYPIDISIPHL